MTYGKKPLYKRIKKKFNIYNCIVITYRLLTLFFIAERKEKQLLKRKFDAKKR